MLIFNIMRRIVIQCFGICLFMLTSCGQEFLEVKSDASISSPQKEEDYLAIMQSTQLISNNSGILGILGGDESYLDDAGYKSINPVDVITINGYLWADDVYQEVEVTDWNHAYAKIQRANLVLDGLQKLKSDPSKVEIFNKAKGYALFFRAFGHFQVAQLFCQPYSKETASVDLGVPLRLESDVTIKVTRATVEQTYRQIIKDLEESVALLTTDNRIKINPTKQSVYALLARVYINMSNFDKAAYYAEEALKIQNGIIDYNTISTTGTYTFANDYAASNQEVILCTYFSAFEMITHNKMRVTPELENLYSANDLRFNVFYSLGVNNNRIFRGSLMGGLTVFNGLTTTEMMLILAECHNRMGSQDKAIDLLNQLRVKRFKTNTYTPIKDLSKEELLKFIYDERRRELAFRGLRWSDLRRFNKEPKLAKDIVRVINGVTYRLEANSDRYTWQIPKKVLDISNVPPNAR